jgi:hypothetical protein
MSVNVHFHGPPDLLERVRIRHEKEAAARDAENRAIIMAMETENNTPPAETKLTAEQLVAIREHPHLNNLYQTVAIRWTEDGIIYGPPRKAEILAALVKAARNNLDAVREHGVTIIVNAAFDATYDKTTNRMKNLPHVQTLENFKMTIDKEIPIIIKGYKMGDISKFINVDYIPSEVDRIYNGASEDGAGGGPAGGAGGPAGGAGGNGSAVGGRRRKNKGRKTRSKSRQNRNRSRKSRRSRA